MSLVGCLANFICTSYVCKSDSCKRGVSASAKCVATFVVCIAGTETIVVQLRPDFWHGLSPSHVWAGSEPKISVGSVLRLKRPPQPYPPTGDLEGKPSERMIVHVS